MHDRAGRPSDVRRYAAEAIGTFALVAIGPGATMVAAETGAFGHTIIDASYQKERDTPSAVSRSVRNGISDRS
jgi:glycerol uptake facilitator-like aquaporin